MSLQIGWTNVPTVTNKERIVLYSTAHSNLIVMGNDTLDKTAIAFDKDQQYTVGREGNTFFMRQGSLPVARFSPSEASVSGSLSVQQDLRVNGVIQSSAPLSGTSLSTSNMSIIAPIPILQGASRPYLSIQRDNGVPILSTSLNNLGDTTLTFDGSVGIGTTHTTTTLHVEGPALFRGGVSLDGPLNTTQVRNPSSNNAIDMSSCNVIYLNSGNTVIKGDAVVEGKLNVVGAFDYSAIRTDNFIASLSLTTQSIIMSNMLPMRPSIGILHRGYDTPYGILDFKVKPSESLNNPVYQALTLDFFGRMGMGTTLPHAVFHIHENSNHARSNLIYAHSDEVEADLVYDRFGHLGVGTTMPLFPLHVNASNEEGGIPIFAITNDSVQRPYLQALSNEVPVFSISRHGSVTVGNTPIDNTWNMCIASNMRVPYIEAQSIAGPPETNTIQLNMASVCNVGLLQGCNLTVQNIRARNSSNDYIYTTDWSIPEFDVFNTRGRFHVKIPTTFVQSSNVIFADSDTDIRRTDDGRVRIYTTENNTSPGLLVSGTTSTVSAAIRAPTTARLLLANSTANNAVSIEYDNSTNVQGLVFKHPEVTIANPFLFNKDGFAFWNKNVGISTNGQLYIGTNIPVSEINAGLYVRQDVRFDSNNHPRLRFVRDTGNIGLGLNTPNYPFHVGLDSVFIRPVRLMDTSLELSGINGRVGVGTGPDSRYLLTINGDVNFNGTLRQRDNFFGSSQWTTDNIGGIFIQGSNVGIGTTISSAQFGLYVHQPALFNSNVTIRGLVSTQGSITSISDRSIKENLKPLHESLECLRRITGYRYDRKDTGAHECGLIAQEVQDVIPELVRPVGSDGSELLSIAYGNMAALFVEAIKNIDTRLSSIEKWIDQQRS